MAAKRRSRAKGTGRQSVPRKSATPVHEPTDITRQMVASMAAIGAKHKVIAKAVGIADDTLRRHYADELDAGKSFVDARVAASLSQRAMAGHTAESIFYAKTRLGWREQDPSESATTINLTITRAAPDDVAARPVADAAAEGG